MVPSPPLALPQNPVPVARPVGYADHREEDDLDIVAVALLVFRPMVSCPFACSP